MRASRCHSVRVARQATRGGDSSGGLLGVSESWARSTALGACVAPLGAGDGRGAGTRRTSVRRRAI